MATQVVRIRRVRPEADGIRSLELVAVDDGLLPGFDAGAHVDVHLGENVIRQYSLINPTGTDGSYRIAVKLEPDSRGGSTRMHGLCEGDRITIGLPRNNFALAAGASHHVLLAGGIGVTPLLGMAYHLAEQSASFSLDYFARSSGTLAFAGEIAGSSLALRTTYHLGLDGGATRQALETRLRRLPLGTHVYACGPAPFMRAVRDILAAWPGAVLHLEYFAADPEPGSLPAGTFRVKLARTDRTVTVGVDETIVEALRSAGVAIETSCEQGVCGTCLTNVLAGRPDHRDMLLTDEEHEAGDKMLLCVSRSLNEELVLDL